MKIPADKVHYFIQHCETLARLTGKDYSNEGKYAPYYEGLKIFQKLRRVENFANRMTTAECNGEATPEGWEDKVRDSVKKIFGREVAGFFVNGDPRGYTLKVREEQAKEAGLHKDWGGYGILAPEY
jgi:hypothetical protein